MSNSTLAPSEKHLEDWLVVNPSKLFSAGVKIVGRQLATPAGRIDILAFSSYFIDVVELKCGSIDGAALFQVLRYMLALTNVCYTAHVRGRYKCDPDIVLRGRLVGHSVTDAVLAAAVQARVNISLYRFDGSVYTFTPAAFESPHLEFTNIMEDPLTVSLEETFCERIGQMYAKWDADANNHQEVQR